MAIEAPSNGGSPTGPSDRQLYTVENERANRLLSPRTIVSGKVAAAVHRAMKRALVLALILGLVWLPACRTDQQQTRPMDAAATNAFLARLDQAITRQGQVYHVSVQTSALVPGKPDQQMYAYVLWIDRLGDRARLEIRSTPTGPVDVPGFGNRLAVGDHLYFGISPGSQPKSLLATDEPPCFDPRPSVGIEWLICGLGLAPNLAPSVDTSVDYHGQRADALVLSTVLRPDPQAPPHAARR